MSESKKKIWEYSKLETAVPMTFAGDRASGQLTKELPAGTKLVKVANDETREFVRRYVETERRAGRVPQNLLPVRIDGKSDFFPPKHVFYARYECLKPRDE